MTFSSRRIFLSAFCFLFNQAMSTIIFVKVIEDKKLYNTLLPCFEKLMAAHIPIPFATICIFLINSLLLCPTVLCFTETVFLNSISLNETHCNINLQDGQTPSANCLLKVANQEMLSSVMPFTFLFFAIYNARLQTEFVIHVSFIVLVFQILQFVFTAMDFRTLKKISSGIVTVSCISLALAYLNPEYLDLMFLKAKIFNSKLENIYRFLML
ncbi:hypothetical protein DSO57_1036996 [Entomophthora muscae]|uniref:Uncharacterized protein n=1 Tax=Entomophthora muscae TaxID=34485 RepID=A0ACC2RQ04_9FUNG|nr:hypothetical protein DSO57_1036996 [Entomophthora muscae]